MLTSQTGPAQDPAGEPTPATGDQPAATSEPAATAGGADSRTTDITAGQGGVMTDEVGVITGDLTVRSDYADGQVSVNVQYKDADEWYRITGARAALTDPADLDAVHTIVCGILHRPGDS